MLLLQGTNAFTQTLADTVNIEEIIVNGRPVSGASGFKVSIIDSSVLNGYGQSNLSDVLMDNSPVFIKSYGLGSLATTSFRGTGAGQTQVLWNGISINSPMLGQSDLSLIPAGMVDNISVYFGGASLEVNSGGIGGIINVESKPRWRDGSDLTINTGTGSFGRYSGLVKYNRGTAEFQSVTRAFLNSAKNDFTYSNRFLTGNSITEKRENAELFQTGFMQEFYFKGENKTTSLHLWYESSDRNLPKPMTVFSNNSTEKQYDSFFRALIKHDVYNDNNKHSYSLSWFADKLDYTNNLIEIDSRNISHSISGRTDFEAKKDKGISYKGSLSDDLVLIKSNNYTDVKTRNLISASISASTVILKRTGLVVLLRQNILDTKIMIPDLSLGFDYRVFRSSNYYIKGNVSRNSRIPTMNDLYWNPGGNSGLKNEYSYNYELSFELNEPIGASKNIKSETTLYNNHIHNMIQWLPANLMYWSPVNSGNIKTSGIEENFEFSYSVSDFSFKIYSGYALTLARSGTDEGSGFSSGKQLVYVPVSQINSGIKIIHVNFFSSFIFNYTGKRYTTTDNSHFLESYSIADIVGGFRKKFGDNNLEVSTRIGNVFGVNYQSIAYQPMPGRSVFINIIYRLTK